MDGVGCKSCIRFPRCFFYIGAVQREKIINLLKIGITTEYQRLQIFSSLIIMGSLLPLGTFHP